MAWRGQADIRRMLAVAGTSVETGAPWYQPQPSALQAQAQCREAMQAIARHGLTPEALGSAAAALRGAAYHAADGGTERLLGDWAAALDAQAGLAIDDAQGDRR